MSDYCLSLQAKLDLQKPPYRPFIQNDSTAWLKKYAQMTEALAIHDQQTKLKIAIYGLIPSKIIKTKDLKANRLKAGAKPLIYKSNYENWFR